MTKPTTWIFSLCFPMLLWIFFLDLPNVHAETVTTAKSIWKKKMGVMAKAVDFDDFTVYPEGSEKNGVTRRLVYYGDSNGCVHCFEEQEDGRLGEEPLWTWPKSYEKGDVGTSNETPSLREVVGLAVGFNHNIYFSVTDLSGERGEVHCLDHQGVEVKQWPPIILEGKQIWTVLSNQKDRIYCVANDCARQEGWVFCYNNQGDRVYEKPVGSMIWGLHLNTKDPDGLTVCGTTYEGELFKLDREGEKNFSVVVCEGKIKGVAMDSKGNFYCGSDDGYLYHLDEEGKELWKVKTCEAIRAVFVDPLGIVYFSSDDHHLYSCNEKKEKLGIFNHINTVYGIAVDAKRRAYFSNEDTFFCVQFPIVASSSWFPW